ncbi:hypothetical protein RLW55_04370 [Hyphomicrobium sp. B1]|uniref:hypothetical protein n=1 Tax=unclassified Hyphomicrobium TaxID=2619925 RepID=UPI0002ECC896|nr:MULTISPECIES: hypothetical protein [unclassified Hyphomicrobium]
MSTKLLMAAAIAAAALGSSLPAFADAASNSAPNAAKTIEPGKVGPGSENNAVVSPTSPDVPINKQPPPEISLPANSGSGSSTGEKGSGPEATTPPHNPTAPGLQ